jgi:hypothetical protein
MDVPDGIVVVFLSFLVDGPPAWARLGLVSKQFHRCRRVPIAHQGIGRVLAPVGYESDPFVVRVAVDLPGVQYLSLRRVGELSDPGLGVVQTLTRIVTLDLGVCSRITSVVPLQTLSTLRHLVLNDCSHIDITCLARLTALETLSVSHVTDSWVFQAVVVLKGLRTIEMHDCAVGFTGELTIPQLSTLTQALTNSPIANVFLFNVPWLTSISFCAALPRLGTLVVENCERIEDEGFACVRVLSSLTRLICAELPSLTAVPPAPMCLVALSMELCRDISASSLEEMTALTELDLRAPPLVGSSEFGDYGIHSTDVSALTQLRTLSLCCLDFHDTTTLAQTLLTLPALTNLDLNGCTELSEDFFLELTVLTTLLELDVRNTDIATWMCSVLRHDCPNHPTVRHDREGEGMSLIVMTDDSEGEGE